MADTLSFSSGLGGGKGGAIYCLKDCLCICML